MTAPLPAGVTLRPDGGAFRYVSQRGHFAPPFNSCMFAALGSVLETMGLALPLPRRKDKEPPENFVLTLHKASGAPLTRGTTTRESQKALQRLFPYGCGVHFGRMTDAALFNLLATGNTARITVNCGKLPKHLKRWIGVGYTGGHAVAVSNVRTVDEVEVFWSDPMGRKAYTGEWVKWSEVSPAVNRSDGRVTAAWGKKGEAEKEIMDELARQLEEAQAALEAEKIAHSGTKSELLSAENDLRSIDGISHKYVEVPE